VRIDKEIEVFRESPTHLYFTSEIPHDLTWDRTWVVAVGAQGLTAGAMARPDDII
jgi:hypothetical protein